VPDKIININVNSSQQGSRLSSAPKQTLYIEVIERCGDFIVDINLMLYLQRVIKRFQENEHRHIEIP
jgi:hypothetical protein